MNDAVVNKAQSIQRCVQRAREEYHAAGDDFLSDYTRQDAAVLNITRACEQAIDLANHVVRTRKSFLSSRRSYCRGLGGRAVVPRIHRQPYRAIRSFYY